MTKITEVIGAVPAIEFICLDVANGYSEHFVEFVKRVRQRFPSHTIMVSCNSLSILPYLMRLSCVLAAEIYGWD